MDGNELAFVRWLRTRQPQHSAVSLGIGDDMAIVETGVSPPQSTVLLSSDMLLDGVHFDTAKHALAQIGRKAIACGLSDCAAMAVKPIAAIVSVALPKTWDASDMMGKAQQLFEGMFAVTDEYEVSLAGGDTTRWGHPLAIDVAIAATPYEGIDPIRRSDAMLGDKLYVTGPLGGSLLGRHLEFTPRVHEAKLLAECLGDSLHAMMDISDGLALDLWRMCEASDVGAVLNEVLLERVISEDARRLANEDQTGLETPLRHALTDGEDFELLFAADENAPEFPITVYPVGEIASGGLMLRRSDGQTQPLEPEGYVH